MNIVRTMTFEKNVARIGASESDIDALIAELATNPRAGDPIQGLKGVRKARFGLPSRNIGKSGGGRAIYLFLELAETIILILAYAKNERADLSPRQRKAILKLLTEIDLG